jgi:hypothetical protein
LNRLGDVGGLDFFGAGEVGDGAADFEDATVGTGALKPNLLMAVSGLVGCSEIWAPAVEILLMSFSLGRGP